MSPFQCSPSGPGADTICKFHGVHWHRKASRRLGACAASTRLHPKIDHRYKAIERPGIACSTAMKIFFKKQHFLFLFWLSQALSVALSCVYMRFFNFTTCSWIQEQVSWCHSAMLRANDSKRPNVGLFMLPKLCVHSAFLSFTESSRIHLSCLMPRQRFIGEKLYVDDLRVE